MRLRTIDAITLFVNDLSKAKAFYSDVFGLPVVFEDEHLAVLRFENDILINLLDGAAAAGLIPRQPTEGAGTVRDFGSRSMSTMSTLCVRSWHIAA